MSEDWQFEEEGSEGSEGPHVPQRARAYAWARRHGRDCSDGWLLTFLKMSIKCLVVISPILMVAYGEYLLLTYDEGGIPGFMGLCAIMAFLFNIFLGLVAFVLVVRVILWAFGVDVDSDGDFF